jgi:cellulose biosynthesis protein BcsQ
MKTLVTAIQKGGQGKTFATCHLAFDFQERGLRVAVIDLDTQGNASWTLGGHDRAIPPVAVVHRRRRRAAVAGSATARMTAWR